ncbi:MAG: in-like serine protease [Chitinophagaceae bacterium]|nr:in-like serine protease [Chitinophagaceae bacterium]
MGKNKYILFIFFLIYGSCALAQEQTYFVQFKDKASNTFSTSSPEQFLTTKALLRRQKCQVPVDEKDLPVTQTYIDQVLATGAQFFYPLKWLNGIVVRSDPTVKAQIASLTFVAFADQSVKFRTTSSASQSMMSLTRCSMIEDNSDVQNDMLGMLQMKADGYNGSGITIAITDDGFAGTDTMAVFNTLFSNGQILDTWDIVDLDKTVYTEGGGHGTHVFSILAGHIPNLLSGPAQGASFFLFRTEDVSSESPLEELNWIRAAEMADSLGVDQIQVSLGYNTFDDSSLDLTQADLDGNTSYISKGATIAATRGLVVIVSAGNYGNTSWGKILCPADAKGILAIGAVDNTRQRSPFSSTGYSADGRVKPDVMAMGTGVTYANSFGSVSTGNGTSFASPLISGLAAGLLQAHPTLTHDQLIQSVIHSADRYSTPDADYGYGIPNYQDASNYAHLLTATLAQVSNDENEWVFPNPIQTSLSLKIPMDQIGYWLDWKLYDAVGALVEEGKIFTETSLINLSSLDQGLSAGIYCLQVSCNNHFSTFKVIK